MEQILRRRLFIMAYLTTLSIAKIVWRWM